MIFNGLFVKNEKYNFLFWKDFVIFFFFTFTKYCRFWNGKNDDKNHECEYNVTIETCELVNWCKNSPLPGTHLGQNKARSQKRYSITYISNRWFLRRKNKMHSMGDVRHDKKSVCSAKLTFSLSLQAITMIYGKEYKILHFRRKKNHTNNKTSQLMKKYWSKKCHVFISSCFWQALNNTFQVIIQ